MSNGQDIPIPAHLTELLQPTPSGMAKLIAAWDGLTPETQIQILAEKARNPGPAYLDYRMLEKALKSDNAYVRYLAARECHFSDDDGENAVKQQIENDPDPLVRYANLESSSSMSLDEIFEPDKLPDKFFALPHEARLAKVRNLTRDDEIIAKLISHAVDNHLKNGKVSELELFEILTDYLNKPELKTAYDNTGDEYDGYGQFLTGEGVKALWELIPIIPKAVAHPIIANLPESAGLGSGIPEHVLKSMSSHQLQTLLSRTNIAAKKLRKSLFFETFKSSHDDGNTDGHGKNAFADGMLIIAAISYNFDLSYEEFAGILANPDERRSKDLENLGIGAQDLHLCFYDAIHDALFAQLNFFVAEWPRRILLRKLKRTKGWQLTELRLYRMAVYVVPWKKGEEGDLLPDELTFLENRIVKGDTWATFMAFVDEWANRIPNNRKLETYLPRIHELDGE